MYSEGAVMLEYGHYYKQKTHSKGGAYSEEGPYWKEGTK